MQKHPEYSQSFAELGLEVRILKALLKVGYSEPSDIQRQLIPVALSGRDILGQARTGTGKTAAFSLPVLQMIDPAERLQAICLVPTRELAVQAAAEIERLSEFSGAHVVAVYGGQKVATQVHLLGKKPHFVVGTPGRVLDFIQRGVLKIDALRFVVLDEVDRMLDIGFRDDIKTILSRVTAPHQTIFVSATIDTEIRSLAKKYMNDPAEIDVSRDQLTVDEIDQYYVTAEPQEKFRLLRMILDQDDPPVTIVFCNTKHSARKLAKKLFESGIDAKEIHGDLIQSKRERVMAKFRKHQIRVLVATDLASRGIDVSAISHIINYDVPPDSQVYVHRIGRTGRMGARGTAITFVTREEGHELTRIEMLINKEIPQRLVDGFTTAVRAEPAPPPPAPNKPPQPARYSEPIVQPGTTTVTPTAKPLPKTLGSKFKPSRFRRRL